MALTGSLFPEFPEENLNTLQPEDRAFHHWYRFVLSFPPHLVRQYLEKFAVRPGGAVLDPFCGTGTTLVECRKLGRASVGVEAHPLAALASRVKTTWSLSPRLLSLRLKAMGAAIERRQRRLRLVRQATLLQPELAEHWGYPALSEDEWKLIPEGFISPRPLLRLLLTREAITEATANDPVAVREFFLLALAYVIPNGAGNFRFGPEIHRTRPQADFDVLDLFRRHAAEMIEDLRNHPQREEAAPVRLVPGDARVLEGLEENSLDAVITSPPYPNEKDYTRITRVESVLLGLYSNRAGLRQVKESLMRSNTRNVFIDDDDGQHVAQLPRIRELCETIERRRIELGKTSGFEKLYHKVVAHYFGGMARHFAALRTRLRPGGLAAYVVGDQLSFFRVPVPTASLLTDVAAEHGFQTVGCDLWRTRHASASGTRVREEVLILKRS